jgi:hypothetical protein
MPKLKVRLLSWLNAFGINPVAGLVAFRDLQKTIGEYRVLRKQNAQLKDKWHLEFSSPQLTDRSDDGGVASGHYFHQDLLVARRVFERMPERHLDVGSRVDGFVAHLAVFREVEVLDIRPIESDVQNIVFRRDDLMNPSLGLTDYCDSLSCLHALEHFGLGRYGDPVDAEGYVKGFAGLRSLLKTSGILYLSVPIGPSRVEFNGQRVFSIGRVISLYKDNFELLNFSYVDDAGDLRENVELTEERIDSNCDLIYGCGIFELKKER